jgi:aspartate kinase
MLVVQKFGGTSVGNVERIQSAANIVLSELELGNQVAVVVSAMSGVTNQLVELCDAMGGSGARTEHVDVVLSSGEIVSAGLMALALNNLGLRSVAMQAWQLPIMTSGVFGHAEVVGIDCHSINQYLENGLVPIVCGFQGVYNGKITTLGRGGSDITATALAAALKASRCDIYTDVDGVYTADPNKIVNARKIIELDYEQMTSMAINGAKVMHPRASDIAKTYRVPVMIKSTFAPQDGGTLLSGDVQAGSEMNVLAVNIAINKVLLSVPNSVFAVLMPMLLRVDHVVERQDPEGAIISMGQKDVGIMSGVSGYKIIAEGITKVTLTGPRMQEHKQLLAKIAEIAQTLGIQVVAQYADAVSLGTFVREKHLEFAQILHDNFVLGSKL